MYILLVRFISEYLIFGLFLLPLYFFLKKDYPTAFKIVLSLAITYAVRKIIGQIWYEPRPYVIDNLKLLYPVHKTPDSSFFSGHASVAMAIAVSVYLKQQKFGRIVIVLAVLVGVGRVLGGLHYIHDVIVGFLAGALISYFVYYLYRKYQKNFKKFKLNLLDN